MIPRRFVAILAADVVGHSRLMGVAEVSVSHRNGQPSSSERQSPDVCEVI